MARVVKSSAAARPAPRAARPRGVVRIMVESLVRGAATTPWIRRRAPNGCAERERRAVLARRSRQFLGRRSAASEGSEAREQLRRHLTVLLANGVAVGGEAERCQHLVAQVAQPGPPTA